MRSFNIILEDLEVPMEALTSTPLPPHPLTLKLPTTDLPSPPAFSPPSPPPPPANPWIWRCHSCGTIYRLAVTRRCLECDHHFCLGGPAPSSSIRGKKRKRSRAGSCKAEFDYNGWSLHNAWRRTVLLNPSSSASSSFSSPSKNGQDKKKEKDWGDEYVDGPREPFEDRRDALFVRKKHNCWLHCDFPSECHHAIYRAQQEGRPILAAAEALDAVQAAITAVEEKGNADKNTEEQHKKVKSETSTTADEELEVVEEEEEEKEGDDEFDVLAEYGGDEHGVSPCLPKKKGKGTKNHAEHEVSPVTPTGPYVISARRICDKNGSRVRKIYHPIKAFTTDAPLEFEIYSDDTHAPAQTAADNTTHPTETYDSDGEADELDGDVYHGRRDTKKHPRRSAISVERPTGLIDFSSFPPFESPYKKTEEKVQSSLPPIENPYNKTGRKVHTADELESAYSENPWYSATTRSAAAGAENGDTKSGLTRRTPGRRGQRNKMLALLSRRTAHHPSSTTTTTGFWTADEGQKDQRQEGRENLGASEDLESLSDSSSSSSSSSGSVTSPSGSGEGNMVVVVDGDGDSPMPDALSDPNDEAANLVDSPVTPVKEDSKDGEPDFITLLKMKNAFMRGDI